MTLRCAVLGGGVMGILHAQVYASLPDVELVAIVEPDPTRHELLGRLPCRVLRDPAQLGDVDAVSACLPDHVRLSALRPFLERGTPLLIEKPFATSVTECRTMMDLAGPDQIMVGQILRFDPRVAALRATVREGELGNLQAGRIWRCSSTATASRIAGRTSVAWFLGIHDVDLVRYVTGQRIAAVRAIGHSVLSRTYDVVRGELVLQNGAAIGFDWSWIWPSSFPAGMTAGLEVVASDGAVTCDLGHDSVHVIDERSGRHRTPDVFHWPMGHAGAPIGDIREEIAGFVGAVRSRRPAPVTASDATESVAVIEAVHRSCEDEGALTDVEL
ncbi:Gfo/Idh/MocA family protein [Georgenia alba]|uniref:Gfo/Idh/MocA family protein n=1 Tax=Georgenia alba TaxID=2233858 RepID=A0ABW2QAE8_9MICO